MRTKTAIFTIVIATLFIGMLSFSAMAAEGQSDQAKHQAVTLTGEINYDGVLITDDGKQFELSGEVGDEVKQMSGQRIQVMGTVMEEDGKQIVDVKDYQIEDKMPAESE